MNRHSLLMVFAALSSYVSDCLHTFYISDKASRPSRAESYLSDVSIQLSSPVAYASYTLVTTHAVHHSSISLSSRQSLAKEFDSNVRDTSS